MNRHFPTVSIITCFLILSTIAYAMEKGEYAPPSLDGYTLDRTKQLDKDEIKDGTNETTLEIYRNAAGQGIGQYTTNGITWAWAVRRNVKDVNDSINNYVIRDSRGDGKFDERYSFAGEEFYLPDWVKKVENK